jgi:hypothetical protein
VIDDDVKNAYFIELKGKDIPHAIEQIDETFQKLKDELKSYIKQYYFRIVCKAATTHNIKDRRVRNWEIKHGYNTIIKEEITDIF